MSDIKNYIIALIVLIIIDMIWLITIMGQSFSQMIEKIQNQPMIVNIPAGIMVYIFLAIGITYFGINRVDANNPFTSSVINGGLFGLICYGVFDFTNLALFTNYRWDMAIIDTIWGSFLGAMTTYISYLIINR